MPALRQFIGPANGRPLSSGPMKKEPFHVPQVSRAQAYAILGTAPCQGHISGVVDIHNACATLWLPTDIFDFDVMPSAAGPTKHLLGGVPMPMSPDK